MYTICKGYDFANPLAERKSYEEAIDALQCIGEIVLVQETDQYNCFSIGGAPFLITKPDYTLAFIAEGLALALEHNLATEVVYSALMYLKQFPSSSIEECMDAGINEWIK